MDSLPVTAVGNLAGEHSGLIKKQASRSAAQGKQPETGREEKAQPEAAPAAARSGTKGDLNFKAAPLAKAAAKGLLRTVVKQIVRCHRWKLAEVQPIVDRELITSAYV